MTAEIIQIRDYQNKRDIQRLYEEVTAEPMAIAGPVEIENVELVNTETLANNYPFPPWPCEPHYLAPEDDPA